MRSDAILFRSLRSVLVTLLALSLGTAAHARPAATPESVYDKFVAAYERQADAAETKLESQLAKADTTIQRLIDRNASEAQIIKAVNTAATGLAKTVRSVATGLIKTANSSKKTLVKMQTAAERRGDDDVAAEAEGYVEELDGFIADVTEEANGAIESLGSYRQQLLDADDLESEYEVVSEAIVSDIEDFIASLSDSGEEDDGE